MAASRGRLPRIPVRVLLPSAAALFLIAAGAVDAGAMARCRELACHTELIVRGDWQRLFRSPQVFRLDRERVSVRLFAAGEELTPTSRSGPGGCRLRLRGAGIAAVASVCGRVSAPLRIAAARPSGDPAELDVVYRARPRSAQGVKGIESEGGAGGGGVGAPTSGGISP